MKDSGVEWIGEIPSDWEIVKLKNISVIKTGFTPSKNNMDDFYSDVKGTPWIKAEDLDTGIAISKTKEYLTSEGASQGRIFPKHTIFVCCIASIGKTGFSDIPCSCNQQINAIIFHSTYWKYGYYMTLAQESEYINNASGNVMKILNTEKQSNLKCPLPPLEAQQRIADFLDKKCGKIDEIIEREQVVIEKLKEYKQSVITEAVTKGLNPNATMKDSGIEWIGKIPEDWEITKIKYVSNFNPSNGKTLLPSDEIGYVPMECLKNGYMLPKVIEYSKITSGLTYFETADIIMAKVTPCFENGNIAIAQKLKSNCAFGSSELFVFRSNHIIKEFLFYFLQNKIFKTMCISTMTGTGGLKRVSFDFIKNYKFALPNQIEQQQIADFLDNKCTKIDKTIEAKQSVIDKLTEYKKSLIYEVVTGKKEVKA